MATDTLGERRVLQLKICSSRRIANPINAFVQIEVGGWSRQTTVKKHTDRPIWNETFILPVDDSINDYTLYLKHRDALGKATVIGKTQVTLPNKMNELQDIWVGLESLTTDVHLCMQVEPLAGRSLESLIQGNRPQSARSSLIRFGTGSLRLFNSFTSSSPDNGDKGSSPSPDSGSTFAVQAGAVTLNEICQSLDRLRGVIYLAGSEGSKQTLDDRQKALQAAKVELDELDDQVEEVDGLSDEWKDKLTLLIEDYSKDCWKMLSDESWANLAVKRQSRVPPPLPPKETLNKIRQERISMALDTSSSSKPATVAPDRPISPNLTSKSPPTSPSIAARVTPLSASGEAVLGTARDHFISSLQAFDSMMDHGFVVEIPGGGKVVTTGKQCGVKGDLVRCRFTAYVWDGAYTQAVAYDSTGDEYLEFILGESHEDVPRGLMAALLKIPNGQSEVIVTVTPEWGFGDDGHLKGVPPNSSLVFELKDIQFSSPVALSEEFEEEHIPRNSPAPVVDFSFFKLYGTFPARDPVVVLDKNPFSDPYMFFDQVKAEDGAEDNPFSLDRKAHNSASSPTPSLKTTSRSSDLGAQTKDPPKRKSLLRSFSSSGSKDPKDGGDNTKKSTTKGTTSPILTSPPTSPGLKITTTKGTASPTSPPMSSGLKMKTSKGTASPLSPMSPGLKTTSTKGTTSPVLTSPPTSPLPISPPLTQGNINMMTELSARLSRRASQMEDADLL